jgi:1-aminocyclopropane-1-carboxylate deaminase
LTASPLQPIDAHPGLRQNIRLFVKRDDLLHPHAPGNKWRKLAPAIQKVREAGYVGILSFGGPFSNHLHALAALCREENIPTAAVVRGTAADPENPTLSFARSCGMQLFPVSKKDYDLGLESPAIQKIVVNHSNYYLLPEGGATAGAVDSCRNIALEIQNQIIDLEDGAQNRPLSVCTPAGTGCTAAGLVAGFGAAATVLIFPVSAKGVDEARVQDYLASASFENGRFQFIRDYIFGGFARFDPKTMAFAQDFHLKTGIQLDPIYTAKMMYGVYDLLERRFFPENSMVAVLHTGGLQGWAGFRERLSKIR